MKTVTAALLLALFASSHACAQKPPEWKDGLAEHMVGAWVLSGQVKGREAHHEVTAEWVLNHMRRCGFSAGDNLSDRYVVHLLDVFGARYSETLGLGTREGNSVRVVFEYPDGPFHSTYTWSPETDTWRWLLEQKDQSGKWTTFADLKLVRAARKP